MRIPPCWRPVMAGFCLSLAAAFLSSPLHAITVDGTAEAAYGAALSVQANATGFGDNTTSTTDGTSSGSEIDQAFGIRSGGMLYLTFAGNLESNYNRLDILIDTGNGLGQNTLAGNTQGTFSGLNGTKFDTGFSPYYALSLNGGGSTYTLYANYATFPSGGGGADNYLGNTTVATNGTLAGGDANGNLGVQVGFNNSNIAGVTTTGGTGAGVTTGFELGIPLSLLGSPTGAIRVSAFIAGTGNNYLSNQFLGSLPAGTANLGNTTSNSGTSPDFTTIAGNQYFTVPAPEPGSVTMLGIGAAALAGWAYRRRR